MLFFIEIFGLSLKFLDFVLKIFDLVSKLLDFAELSAWSPSGHGNFHMPQYFGLVHLD